MTDKRRTGRPPLDRDDTTVKVTVSMPSRLYDRMDERAKRDRVNLPTAIRRALESATEDEDDDA